jgi:hypothetical protein
LSLRNDTRKKGAKIRDKNGRNKNYQKINALIGWGAWTRTRECRNQNPTTSSMISKRILRFWLDSRVWHVKGLGQISECAAFIRVGEDSLRTSLPYPCKPQRRTQDDRFRGSPCRRSLEGRQARERSKYTLA